MKKLLVPGLVLASLLICFSCNSGPKALTEDEMDKKISELTSVGKDSLAIVLDKNCTDAFPKLVAGYRDSLLKVNEVR